MEGVRELYSMLKREVGVMSHVYHYYALDFHWTTASKKLFLTHFYCTKQEYTIVHILYFSKA